MSAPVSRHHLMGILFALCCLILVGIMPVVANSRPVNSPALSYALLLSLWQLLFSLPLAVRDWRAHRTGKHGPSDLMSRRQWLVLVGTGLLFGISTFFYILAAQKAGAVGAAIAIQAYPLFAILIESLFLGKRKSLPELGLTLVMISTIIYLATDGNWRLDAISYWFVFALSIPFIWSIAHISLRQVMRQSRVTPGIITCVRVLVSSCSAYRLAMAVGRFVGFLVLAW